VTPLPEGREPRENRKKQGAEDLEYFGKTYFPHYVYAPCSAFHKYMCKKYADLVNTAETKGKGDRAVDAAPRGNAKSTWICLIFIIWCIAYKKRKFALIISATNTQAEDFINFIKTELEINEYLKQDFPEMCGEGPVWKSDTIVTRNGAKIRGAGAGQKFKGVRHGNKRPDVVVVDDLENDESVESAEQRKKLERWFFKALMKIGQKDTVYIVIGTILHYDSLLSNLFRQPGWKGKIFKAIITKSISRLWERWEEIFSDISQGQKESEALADDFFKQHEAAMLAGTKVLWPEVEDYYYLMKMRVSEGPAYFESEKQNEPINPEDAVFLEEWFTDWEDADLSGALHVGSCDPSLGKRNKRSDPSAIIAGVMKDSILYLTIADIEKRQPDKIMTDLLLHHQRTPFDKLRIEAIQFQEFFARQFEKIAHSGGQTINIDEYMPNTDKDLRIVRLQPWIKNGWIRFKKGMYELKRQLVYYRPKGKGGHDDGPDALEALLSLCESGLVKAVTITSEPTKNDYHADIKDLRSRHYRRRVAA